MMTKRRLLVVLAAAALTVAIGAGEGRAATFFGENFNIAGPLPGPNLEQSSGPGASFNGVNATFAGAGSRSYLRTVDDDYNTVNYSAYATVTIPGGQAGWGLVFAGMGTGEPDAGFYGEPRTGAHIYARPAPDDFAGGGVVTTDNSVETSYTGDRAGNGTHRLRMDWDSATQQMSFAIHQDYTGGPFVATSTYAPVTGADNGFNTTNSRVFFGGANGAVFDDFEITSYTPPLSTFTGGDAGDGLDLEGNFLYAVNVGTAGIQAKSGGPYNVGDVVFAHDGANSGMTNTQSSVINNWATPNLGASPNDDNLEYAMQSIRHGGAVPAQINLDGLTPGREYKLQMAFTESCCTRGFDILVEGALVADDFAPYLTQGATTNAPTNGAVVTHTFTAGDTTANIVFNGAAAPFSDKNPILSAITLEDVSPNFSGNVALGKPIIDGSSAYNGLAHDNNSVGFATVHVTDGSDTDVSGQSYWLGTQGQVNQFFVLDLEKPFQVDQIDLRNTHNTNTYNDRGTAGFQIRGSNNLAAITGGSSSEPIILTGTLSNVTNLGPIPADSFTSANGLLAGQYQYLRFETLSSTYGNNNVGLNEIEVFGQLPPPSPYADAVNALNPHGYWRLGESGGTTAVNEVGYVPTENGEYQNGPTLGVAGIPGGGGTAADFDGINDRVRMMDPHDPTDYTLTAWVKMDTLLADNTWQNVLWRTDSGESGAFSHILQVIDPAGPASGPVFLHYTYDGAGRSVLGTTEILPDQWYHVAGVYHPGSPGYMSLYVNGVLDANWVGNLNNPWTGGDRWLIADSHASGSNFDGTIDDVAIFHRLLTAQEIAGLYKAGITVIPEPITMLAVVLSLGGLGRYVRRRRMT